ncbi:MarR family transcriptional regulator [Nonomuraea africana]|uniref:DNA-binding MarR family transcriptional regulator n=1 Tax=Nonomuraea africana TaxID=46171 RepID=A0ABR9KK38_9ACTN|nr:MarR family transcriptional regulator [Nonomuraea africana]MBE1562388.1 DNA-binding MarR family transcriptional regulator [Nonomuraea africana]
MDEHLARWHGKAPYDERVEAIITRMQLLVKHVRHAKEVALAEVGIQDFEFETLHRLAARDSRQATPSELASELLLSPAGMTGRVDTLEKAGLVRRIRSEEDRRRVDVELTEKGHRLWSAAMNVRAMAEAAMVSALAPEERETLDGLLKRMLVSVETRP